MEIDWITVIAQAANFLILLWILKRLLFKRIVRLMDERERSISKRIEDADVMRLEAQREKSLYIEMNCNFRNERDRMIADVDNDIEAYRERVINATREEVRHTRDGWMKTLQDEKMEFLTALSGRISLFLFDQTKKVLAELGDDDAQRRVVAVFIRKLDSIDDKQKQMLLQATGIVLVRTPDVLLEESRRALERTITKRIPNAEKKLFVQDETIVYGIVLVVNNVRVAWTVESYMEKLQETIDESMIKNTVVK